MLALPFHKIRQIEHVAEQVSLADLTLVFSKKESDEYLLVYNTTSLPPMPSSSWRAKSLDDLVPNDYATFDGPVVGFSALDVVFRDIQTHGVNFYLIQRIFERQGKQALYQDTAYRLAKWLFAKQQRFTEPQRGFAKIIELALPKLLASQQVARLVAILPHHDLEGYLSNQSSNLRMIYAENVEGLIQVDPEQWLVGLEEVVLFNPKLQYSNPHFIDLRVILRQARRSNALRETCLALARRCWLEWQKIQNADFRKAAFTLATEAWLMNEDIEDLIVFMPHQDFEEFAQTGNAIRIYRTPQINSEVRTPGLRYSLGELANDEIPVEKAWAYTLPLSFAVLSPALERLTSEPIVDLGPVLYRAGRETELARTFWLLSADLLRYSVLTKVVSARSDDITALALRTTAIYSLSDPWHKQWHARYNSMLEQAYVHLDACLLNQEQRVTDRVFAEYFRALRGWYGCFTSPDIPHTLNIMRNACHDFLQNTEKRTDLKFERHTAERLANVVERLTTRQPKPPTRSSQTLPAHFEVHEYLSRVVNTQDVVDTFSEPFDKLLDAYESCHRQWQTFQENLSVQRPSDEDFHKLLANYAFVQRGIYAPAHEAKLLHWACQQDIERIERLRKALGKGPLIRFQVLNPQVILKRREHLTVEIENIGGAVAQNFEITLSPSQRFDLLSNPKPFSGSLDLRRPYRVEWEICPSGSPVELHFSYSFQHNAKTESHEEEILLLTIPAHEGKNPPKGGNPYQAGPPVSADGFFGRKEELKIVLRDLLSGITQPIMLRGPRRIGKSSILHQLNYLLTHEGELQNREGFSIEDEARLRGIHPVLTSLQEIPDVNFIARWFQRVFENISESIGVEFEKEQMIHDFEWEPYGTFTRYLDRLFRKRPEIRLLVMIDEWDEQRHLGELGTSLRAIMQQEQRVNWIVSSTWTLGAEMGKFGSPFYGQMETIELKAMAKSDAERLILEHSKSIGVDWHGDAVVALLDQTARRPHLVQTLCRQITHHLYRESTNLVDPEIVQTIVSEFIVTPQTRGQPFDFLWEAGVTTCEGNGKARLRWLGRLILWVLDIHSPADLTLLEIKEAVQSTLRQRNLAIPNEEFFDEEFNEQRIELEYIFDTITQKPGGRYGFGIPLAQRWFHHFVSQHPDPVYQAYLGILQDYEKWKIEKAKKNAENKNG